MLHNNTKENYKNIFFKHTFYFSFLISLTIVFFSSELFSSVTVSNIAANKNNVTFTKGLATASSKNLFTPGQRISKTGTIKMDDGTVWQVPASTHFTNSNFPTAPNLYNPYAEKYINAQAAKKAFKKENIITVNENGNVIVGYIFADNYFELYINGKKVGKDAVPFTKFNSHIVQFKVKKPFTIAMLLVDWEENLGIGSEANRGTKYHAGDGGMVAVFTTIEDKIIAITNNKWKVQVFYAAPIFNKNCITKKSRNTKKCSTETVNNPAEVFAAHWELPQNWMQQNFNHSSWQNATTYSNKTIGINNKKAYTNFANIFDNPQDDAEFIWSKNVVIDNLVAVRYTVK